jgi:hypothetical protein
MILGRWAYTAFHLAYVWPQVLEWTTASQVKIVINILPNVNTISLKALLSKTLLNDDRTPMKNPRSANNHQIQGITKSPPLSPTTKAWP